MPGNPLDSVPLLGWITIALGIAAIAPASYCWRYLTHTRRLRDITLPPEDLSWKSKPAFYRSLAMLAALLGFGVVAFTPQAEAFAKSEWLAPTLFGAIGGYVLSTVAAAWRTGEVEPMLRGTSWRFQRDEQPKRYWASLSWNFLIGSALSLASIGTVRDALTPRCDDPDSDDVAVLEDALSTCNTMLAQGDNAPARQAELFAARGRIYDRLGRSNDAQIAYSRAIDLDPTDSYALYNRGALLLEAGKPAAAIRDLDASLSLRPDNDEGYFRRGVAHASLRNFPLAERDFAKVATASTFFSWAVRGRAAIAIEQQRYDDAIAIATRFLADTPDDPDMLKLRADAYWKSGHEALARVDDERRMDLLDVVATAIP